MSQDESSSHTLIAILGGVGCLLFLLVGVFLLFGARSSTSSVVAVPVPASPSGSAVSGADVESNWIVADERTVEFEGESWTRKVYESGRVGIHRAAPDLDTRVLLLEPSGEIVTGPTGVWADQNLVRRMSEDEIAEMRAGLERHFQD